MKNILVVVGSARKGRVADTITHYITDDLAKREDAAVTIADLAALDLPFYNDEYAPSHPDHHTDEPHVQAWSKLVREADAVVFVTPEYNHSLSAIQKNAIDWLYAEWEAKPVAVVAYGWYAGKHSLAAIREMASVIKIDLKPTPAQLTFTAELNVDGSAIDEAAIREKIKTALDEIV